MGIVVRRRVHLGLAIALPAGMAAPVIYDAQDLNLRGMARALADAIRRAEAGVPRPGAPEGGTFTISSHTSGALWSSTPPIFPLQSASLGVGVVRRRPLVISANGADQVVVRPTAVLTLAYDARVLDQCGADAFLRDLQRNLAYFQV
jgi:pyruvate/2-oxoglutarate dehydrogenase complex dihydrolipoamide acyltransferase (E2) component